MQNNEIKAFNNNMATVANGISDFSGRDDEDVIVWIRDFMTITKIIGSTPEEVFKLMVLKLKGQALSWASELLESRQWNLTLDEFVVQLKQRFAGHLKTELTLSSFLNTGEPTSKEEFLKLLRDGTILFEKQLMSTETIMQILISKCPDKIQAVLYTESEKAINWGGFVQRAQKLAWLAYPDKTLSRITMRKFHPSELKYNDHDIKKEKYCALHGTNTSHTTSECFTLKRQREKNFKYREKQGKKTAKAIQAVENVHEPSDGEKDSQEEEIKRIYNYSLNVTSFYNPFFIYVKIGSKLVKGLVDTGADVSLIPRNIVPRQTERIEQEEKIKSACGNAIKIEGRLKKLKFTVNDTTYSFSPFVTTDKPNYVILGIDAILENPEILIKLLQTKLGNTELRKKVDKSLIQVRIVEKDFLMKKYADLFSKELDGTRTCLIGSHKISTTTDRPINQRNGRVPIHFEAQIESEIKKIFTIRNY